MTTDPAAPSSSLASWVEQDIQNIYKAIIQSDLNAALDAFLANDASITVNGKATTRQQYVALLQGEKTNELTASVKFGSPIVVPSLSLIVPETGSVGVTFEATVTADTQETSCVHSSLNVFVVRDVAVNEQSDPRRVTVSTRW